MTSYRNTVSICCILLIALIFLCSPAAARTVSSGDTISVGEEGLDLTGLDPAIVSLVHYSDFAADAADNSIAVTDPSDFDLAEADVGGITGTYYAWDASGLIGPETCIEVQVPPDPAAPDPDCVAVAETGITMTAYGSGTYAFGDEILLSGTCTNNTVFLFLTGPNLAINGVKLHDVTTCVIDGSMATFTAVAVEEDGTWEYRWDTSNLGAVMDPGSYTIYAEPEPRNYANLGQYATVDVAFEMPKITARAHPASVVHGDRLVISGTTTGSPDNVYVWIFGPNFRLLSMAASVAANGTFAYTLHQADTACLASGQYDGIIQHPMMNGCQDVCYSMTNPNNPAVYGQWLVAPGMTPVNLEYMTSSAIRDTLTDALRSPAVDDIYTIVRFWIGDPWIVIDPVGDRLVDTAFLINGTTNLAAGETLTVTVTNVSNLAVTSGSVTVGEGALNNTWSFEVGASALDVGVYIVTVDAASTGTSRSAAFQVVESIVPTPVITTLDLAPGWNFVSVPKKLADGNNNASMVFGDVDTAGHSLFRYDAATKLWSALDADSAIEPLNGYWVYANTSTAVDLIYAGGSVATPPSKTLSAGWNAIGFSSTVSASARDALSSVAGSWTNAIGWDADLQEYDLAIVNGGSGAYSDSRTMELGQGYWLFMTNGGELAALTG